MGSVREEENFLIDTMNDVAAVFLFANTVVVVEKDGSTSTIDRYNGNFDGHVTLGSL
jgi:2',3'-cyclic-nucleotide 2'-phosphodiesterase (5'-nucleotidase family)